MRYDAADRLTSMVDPSGNETTLGYDTRSQLRSLTDPGGAVTEWAYDEIGRVETRTDALDAPETFTYDAAGNLASVTDRRGVVTEYDRDILGRLEGIDFGVTATDVESSIEYSYDSVGRLEEVDDSAYGIVDLGYDAFDRLSSETTPQGTVTYGYDDNGRRTSMAVQGGPSTSYGYDDTGALTSITQGSLVVSTTRDALDRPGTVTLPNGVTANYEFDPLGQVTKLVYRSDQATDPIGDVAYTYDPVGRRRTASGSLVKTVMPDAVTTTDHNAANQVTEWGAADLVYDDAGNLTDDSTNTYTWNARGELAAIDGSTDASFEYDPFGRRTEKTIGTETTTYRYDGANIIGEQRIGGASSSYLTGLSVDEVFARSSGGTTSSYLVDGLGSTVGLVDQNRTVATKYGYGPFGNSTAEGTADPNPFQFAGRENDGNGLHYNRARYYSPQLGRFISEDPIGYSSGDTNLYSYVANNPVNATDPSGTCTTFPQVFSLIFQLFDILGRFMSSAVDLRDAAAAESWSPDQIAGSFRAVVGAVHAEVAGTIAATCGLAMAGAMGAVPARGLWQVTPEGTSATMRHTKFGTFSKSASDGLWWSRDTAGHGGSVWKVYEETSTGLRWLSDADEFGTFIADKHKGAIGRFIPWKELFG